jgi:hypothetical protein
LSGLGAFIGAVNPEEVARRLPYDTPLWARHCAKIIGTNFRLIDLEPYPWQLKLDAALEAQRAAGLPQRAIILKARKLGFSTWVAAKLMQRLTMFPFQKALVVAHDTDTGGELFGIGDTIYKNLPLELKPHLTNRRDSKGGMKYLRFLVERDGQTGESSIEIETAGDVRGGRGYTPSLLHLSEIAHYEKLASLTSLLNAVPETPETMIVQESTANGMNHFERAWKKAIRWDGDPAAVHGGETGYLGIFAPWHEFPDYATDFASGEEREEFEESLGRGEVGEDEPMLIELFGCTLEQLKWRRRKIHADHDGDLLEFKQEYPATPEEAFKGSGRPVFSISLTAPVLLRTEETHPDTPAPRLEQCPPGVGRCPVCKHLHGPELGILKERSAKDVQTREGIIHVPTSAEFAPAAATGFGNRHPFWHVWEFPIDRDAVIARVDKKEIEAPTFMPGQYVIGCDVSGGEEMTSSGDRAWHSIQVRDHISGLQVARWRSRVDPHELARDLLLAALFWNKALVGVEITGGWGWPPLRMLHRTFRYRQLYKRKALGTQTEKEADRLGWQTDSMTKPDLEAYMTQLLKEGRDGIRDAVTADQLTTHVRDEKGRTGPEPDHFNDDLMAWMIACQISREHRPRPYRKPGEVLSANTRRLPT